MVAPVVLMWAAAGVTAAAAIYQGRVTAAQEKMRRQQIDMQMTMDQIRMRDEAIQRKNALAALLGEQAAIGAQGGFDPFAAGSSFLAVREEEEEKAEEDVTMIRLIGETKLSQSRLEKKQSKLAGTAAKNLGYMKAVGTLATAGYSASTLGGGGGGGKTWVEGTPRKLS